MNILLKISIIFIFLVHYNTAFAKIYKKGIGTTINDRHVGASMIVDFDKSYLSGYVNFIKKQNKVFRINEKVSFKDELYFYGDLFMRSLLPKYFLLEADVYPLTTLGGYINKNHKSFYDSSNIWNVNLIQLISTRYETPYGFSMFLGEIFPVFHQTGKQMRQTGSSVMGHVLSIGQYRLIVMDLLRDNWVHYEYKIKGTNITKRTQRKWSFNLGAIYHRNKRFFKAITFKIIRDWASKDDPSFWANFKFEYLFNIPIEHVASKQGYQKIFSFQKFVIGQNFPFEKFILHLDIGFKWELYKTENLARAFSRTTFILAPNISF